MDQELNEELLKKALDSVTRPSPLEEMERAFRPIYHPAVYQAYQAIIAEMQENKEREE